MMLILLLLMSGLPFRNVAGQWTNCAPNRAVEALVPETVTSSPDHATRGVPMTTTVSGTTVAAVPSSATMRTSVFYAGWNVYSTTKAFCAAMACPVALGPFILKNEQTIPSLAPPGSYSLQLEVSDGTTVFMCVHLDFHMQSQKSIASAATEDSPQVELPEAVASAWAVAASKK